MTHGFSFCRNGSIFVIFKLTFNDGNRMPSDTEKVLEIIRVLVQNGSLGEYQLDVSSAVCEVDLQTGNCVAVSSDSTVLALDSSSLFFESSSPMMLTAQMESSMILQQDTSSLSVETSPMFSQPISSQAVPGSPDMISESSMFSFASVDTVSQFDSSDSVQPADTSQLPVSSSFDIFSDTSIATSSEVSNMIPPSLVSSQIESSSLHFDSSSQMMLTSALESSTPLQQDSSSLSFESSQQVSEDVSLPAVSETPDIISQSSMYSVALDSSEDMSYQFSYSDSVQPSDTTQLSMTASFDIFPDTSIALSSGMSDMILPSLVSSEDFQASSASFAAPLTVASSMKITNVEFNEQLANKTSAEFREFETNFCGNVSLLV